MSDKAPKRGILSSLMGLFGDDAQAEAEEERKAAQGESSPDETQSRSQESAGTVASAGAGDSVVRESYEPGWYAVSTARTQRPTFVSEPWGGTTLPPVDASEITPPAEASATQTDEPATTPAGWEQQPSPSETPVFDPQSDETAHAPASIYTQPYSHEPVQLPNEPLVTEPLESEAVVTEPAPPPWQEDSHVVQSWQPAAEQTWEEPAQGQAEQTWEPPEEQSWQPAAEQTWEEPAQPEHTWQDDGLPEQSWEEPEPAQSEQSWEEPEPAQSDQSWENPEDDRWSLPEAHVEAESLPTQVEETWSVPEPEPAGAEDGTPESVSVEEPHASVLYQDEASGEPSTEFSTSAETDAMPSLQDLDVDASEMADAEAFASEEPVAEAEAEPAIEAVVYGAPEPEEIVEANAEPEPVVESEPAPEADLVAGMALAVAAKLERAHEPEQGAETDTDPEDVVEPEPEAVVESEPVLTPVVEGEAEPVVEATDETTQETEAFDTGSEEPDTAPDEPVVDEPVAETVQVASDEAVADEPEDENVEDAMPAPEPELATVPAPPAPEEKAGLQSRVAADRRSALDELVARGLTEDEVPAVAALLQDPERGIRVAVLESLVARADDVDAAAVRQALRDPSDEVRAGAVRLAAARSAQDVPEMFGMVAERQWPGTQQAALEALPGAISAFGVSEDDLDALLRAVAEMDSEPNAAERTGFAALAAAVGTNRLAGALDTVGDPRIGAALLLLQDGSQASMRALAPFARDPDPEVARLGRAAFDRLEPDEEPAPADEEPEQPMETTEEQTVESFEAELGPQGEIVSGLARALGDPDEAVRGGAADALKTMDRHTLIGWALAAMGSNDPSQVELGAQVAEAAGLTETAGELIARGAAMAAEARGPFSRALGSFQLSPEQLGELVDSMDSQSKPEGVRMLWHIGGRSLLPAVQPLLDDSSAAVRVAALEVFGESADAQTIEVAQRVLERDSSPVVRATAISVIGRAGLDQRAASLAQALADPDPDVRATAVEVLPAGMGRQAAELLLEALGDEDERVWQAAIRHLASVPDRDRSIVWQAIERCPANRREHLVATLERSSAERLALLALDHLPSPDAAERTLAITLAGRAGTPECVRGIVQSLQDPAPTVRRTAASALLTLRSGESIAGLSRALSDPDVEVRVEAVRALSVIDDDNVLDPLITALKDPEMRVRDVAGEALVRWRSPAVARRLAIALTNPSLRRPAGEVLARMGNSAVDPLVDILMEDDSELAGTVGHLLESLVGPDVFLTRLGSMDATDRLRAVEALGAIRGERGVDGLVRALSDPVESIRVRAVGLLGEIGDERAFEAVKQAFLSDPVLEVVSAAEEALKRLQGGQNPQPSRQ